MRVGVRQMDRQTGTQTDTQAGWQTIRQASADRRRDRQIERYTLHRKMMNIERKCVREARERDRQ